MNSAVNPIIFILLSAEDFYVIVTRNVLDEEELCVYPVMLLFDSTIHLHIEQKNN